MGGPPGGVLVARALVGPEPVQRLDEVGHPVGEGGRALAAAEEHHRLDDRSDAVPGHGQAAGLVRAVGVRGPVAPLAPPVPAVHQGAQGRVQVEMGALHPVAQLLVGEPVAGPGGNEQSLGQHGGSPAGAPGEDLLERLPVQLALAGPRQRRAASWTWPETRAASRRTSAPRGCSSAAAAMRTATRTQSRSRWAPNTSSVSGRPGTSGGRAARTSARRRRVSGCRSWPGARAAAGMPYASLARSACSG